MSRVLRVIFCAITGLILSSGASAQQVPGVEETGVIYRKVSHTGVTLHSAGFGINYRRGHRLTGFRNRMADVSLFGLKHPKEVKSVNHFSESRMGYVYGKSNSLVVLRTGLGTQRSLYEKGDKNGVAIMLGLFGGISWGFVKPVYLTIFYSTADEGIHEKIERYDASKHFPDNISGRASFFRGLDETSLYPGLYTEASLNFEINREQQRLRMIECGVMLDAFPRRVPIMANTADSELNRFLFLNFFIRALIGKRWN